MNRNKVSFKLIMLILTEHFVAEVNIVSKTWIMCYQNSSNFTTHGLFAIQQQMYYRLAFNTPLVQFPLTEMFAEFASKLVDRVGFCLTKLNVLQWSLLFNKIQKSK